MSNVIKGNYGYSFRDENTRVIDTNQIMAARLDELSRVVQTQAEDNSSFGEDFTQGLEAFQVEKLLEDDGDESSSNVIKASEAQGADEEQQRVLAGDIVEKANAQARDILADARAEAEEIKNAARSEGERIGYDTGYEKGEADGLAQYDARLKDLVNERQELERQYEAQLDELEPKFVEVFTSVYEHVFRVNLSGHKEIIFYLIQNALRKIENNKNFIIHVSKDDYGFVSMQKRELLSGIAGGDSAEIVEDMTLHANECFIDTGVGIFDCSLETQLEGLKRELRLLSFTPGEGT